LDVRPLGIDQVPVCDTTTADWIAAGAAALAAAGTVAAVVLALWLQVWRERRTRPDLALVLPRGQRISYSSDGFYGEIEVAVTNRPDRRTAREVEVLLSAYALEDTEHYPPAFRDQPLRWINHDRITVDIPPSVERRCVALLIGDPRAVYEQAGLRPAKLDEIDDAEVVQRYLGFVGAFPGGARVPGDIRWLETEIPYELWMTVTAADTSAKIYRAAVSVTDHGSYVTLAWLDEPEEMERVAPTGIVVHR
jgi:hypothetical protein